MLHWLIKLERMGTMMMEIEGAWDDLEREARCGRRLT